MTTRAYVTLVTNADFARGAGALLRSLSLAGTTADRVVLHTGGVPNARVTELVAEVLHGLEELTAGGTGRKPIVVVVAG